MTFGAPSEQQPTTPAPAAAPDAGAGAGTPPAPAPNEPPAVHPAWDKALEGIPDLWQKPVREQIRTTEAEYQRALEAARQGGVPDDWRGLYQQAQEAGLSPEDLVNGYISQQNLLQAMVEDPDQFVADISAQIDAAVAAGQLTRREGAALKRDAAGAAADAGADDLLTPEQKELQELRQRIDQREQAEYQAQQQWQTQQAQQEMEQIAEGEAQDFIGAVHDAFDSDPQLAGASAATRQIAARVADGLLNSDTTGTLTNEAAVAQSIALLREQLGWSGAPAPAGGAQPNIAAAIGGGSGAPLGQQPPKFNTATPEGREERDAALVEFLKAQNAANAASN